MRRDYFLTFSPGFFQGAPNRARRICNELANLREEAQFREGFARFLGPSTSDIGASP